MRQTATFEVSTAGVDRPSAGTRGVGMAFGCWEPLRSGAIAGR